MIIPLFDTVNNVTQLNVTRHNAGRTHCQKDTTPEGHIARNTYGCAQAPAARLTGALTLQGLLLLYPACALIVRPYADSSELS